MAVRKMSLPPGWYPRDEREIDVLLRRWGGNEKSGSENRSRANGAAGVVPHAGWAFSGALAYRVISALRDADLVIIAGGHLPRSADPLAVYDDGMETPLGVVRTDGDFLSRLEKSGIRFIPDRYADNTIEVQLPMIKYRFPDVPVLAIRLPPSDISIRIGETVAAMAESAGRSAVFIGSTDLTHYGPNYGFSPRGTGEDAVEWVRSVNDRRFIDAALECRPEEMVRAAAEDDSACSAGAAAAACRFAMKSGRSTGDLVGYASSYDNHPADSFVGYAGVLY